MSIFEYVAYSKYMYNVNAFGYAESGRARFSVVFTFKSVNQGYMSAIKVVLIGSLFRQIMRCLDTL